jgi:hypothetical protein
MSKNFKKKELQVKTLKRMQDFHEKHKGDKPVRRICDENLDLIIYRRLLVQKYFDEVDVFDNSTDVYRPLSSTELKALDSMSIDKFCNYLFLTNTIERLKNNRYAMQLGIAKGNEKEKEYHYKIAMQEIKSLREFLYINKN